VADPSAEFIPMNIGAQDTNRGYKFKKGICKTNWYKIDLILSKTKTT